MPLIKPIIKSEKVSIRASIDKGLLDEMSAYCSWAEIKKTDDFIEQAIRMVLVKDKDWHAQKTKR